MSDRLRARGGLRGLVLDEHLWVGRWRSAAIPNEKCVLRERDDDGREQKGHAERLALPPHRSFSRRGGQAAGKRLPVSARMIHKSTTLPMKATRMLQRLIPVAPACPNTLNSQPPMMAPMMPMIKSPNTPPGPWPGTTALARKPAMMPTTIQAMMLTVPQAPLVIFQDVGYILRRATTQTRLVRDEGSRAAVLDDPRAVRHRVRGDRRVASMAAKKRAWTADGSRADDRSDGVRPLGSCQRRCAVREEAKRAVDSAELEDS